jgi:hypothetical protein
MTRHELERIATLANHPGFKALLTLLDEEDAVLLERLESTPNKDETALLNLWRASRRFKKLIENRPQDLHEQLGMALGDVS